MESRNTWDLECLHYSVIGHILFCNSASLKMSTTRILANPLEVAFLATAGECVDVKMSVHLKRCWVSTARAVHVGLSETMLHTFFWIFICLMKKKITSLGYTPFQTHHDVHRLPKWIDVLPWFSLSKPVKSRARGVVSATDQNVSSKLVDFVIPWTWRLISKSLIDGLMKNNIHGVIQWICKVFPRDSTTNRARLGIPKVPKGLSMESPLLQLLAKFGILL